MYLEEGVGAERRARRRRRRRREHLDMEDMDMEGGSYLTEGEAGWVWQ